MKPWEEELYAKYAMFRVHKQLRLYVLPLIIVVGVVGNTLTVLILTRPTFRRVATYTYLTAVAIADTLVLIAAPLRLWLGELTDLDPRDYANWSCKTIYVFTYTVSVFSVWLLVAVTVERYLAVSRPLRVPTECTRQRAVMVILGLFAAALAVNAHFAWTLHVQSHQVVPTDGSNATVEPKCDARLEHSHLVVTIWPWIDFICYFCFPFVVIAVLNSLIIHRVVKARRQRGSMSGVSGSSMYGENSHKPRSMRLPSCSDEIGVNTKLAIMLMTVSFTFLLLALPMNSLNIVVPFLNLNVHDLPAMTCFTLVRTVLEMLMYTNHAVNFYLYCATGQKFRRQLYAFVCSGCLPTGALSGTGGVSPRNDIHGREKGFSLWRDEGSERGAKHSRTARNASSYRAYQPSRQCERLVAESAL